MLSQERIIYVVCVSTIFMLHSCKDERQKIAAAVLWQNMTADVFRPYNEFNLDTPVSGEMFC